MSITLTYENGIHKAVIDYGHKEAVIEGTQRTDVMNRAIEASFEEDDDEPEDMAPYEDATGEAY